MGYLGILFKLEFFNNDNKFLLNNIELKENIVIFIERPDLNYNLVLGTSSFFKEDKCSFFYLDKFSDLKPFLVFDKSIFRYGKISLGENTIVDYDCFTFWFNVKSYTKLREFFLIEEEVVDFESQLKDKVLKILDYV